MNIVSFESGEDYLSTIPDGLALNFKIADFSSRIDGDNEDREKEEEQIDLVNHNVHRKETFIISEDHLREYIQLERQQTSNDIDGGNNSTNDHNGKNAEISHQNLNPVISTFVLSSFVGDDDVINICLADDQYPAVEITNNCNVILALREAEEGADVSKHYPVLENRADRMMVLKPNQRIPFVPAKFKTNFPKLANPIEFNCQLALYTSSNSEGGGTELSKPVKIHVDSSNVTVSTSTPFCREEEVYVPSFGHVYLTMTQRNAQLFVNISSSASNKNREVNCFEKQKTSEDSSSATSNRTGMYALPSFDVKLSSVDVILIDRVDSANPKQTDAIFSASASQLRVSHTKMMNTIIDDTNAGNNQGSEISSKSQASDGIKDSSNTEESSKAKKYPNNGRESNTKGTSSLPTRTSELLISLGNIQIDNQIHDDIRFHFPVILLPMRNISQRYHTATDHAPFADLQASEDVDFLTLRCLVTSSPSLVSIDDVTLDLQPFEMFLEDVFVYKLLELSKRYLPKLVSANKHQNRDNVDRLAAIKPVLYPIRVCRFHISEIQFLLSIHASVKVFLAADHMPLKLGAFQCQPTQTVGDEFARAVLYHYATQVLVRAGWIVGSFELIGNPTGFIHKMGQGISDFVMMPYHGLTRGPTAFVTGISQGLSSFVKHASTGTLTSITNVSSSISRNLDRLCLDETHMRLQEERRAQVPMQTMSGIYLFEF